LKAFVVRFGEQLDGLECALGGSAFVGGINALAVDSEAKKKIAFE
jgi:hypothetical protein